ncbi:ring canal kelch-like protein [halophilic archaeon]|nr:ring canal kelch-like protein [halophilic archaeon]
MLIGGGIVFFLGGMVVIAGLPTGIPQPSTGGNGNGPGTTGAATTTTQSVTQTTAATTEPTETTQSTTTTQGSTETTRTTSTTAKTTRTTTTTARSQQRVLYRVNVGGPRIRMPGPDWLPDTENNPSQYGNARQSVSHTNRTSDRISVTSAVPDGTPRKVFKTRRWDADNPTPNDDQEMQYQFPVPDGKYVVRVYLAETYIDGDGWNANEKVGPRTFDVAVEGQVRLNNYNMYEQLGHDRGTVKRFPTTVTDGALFVTFLHEQEDPMISGIEIVRVGDAGDNANDRERTGVDSRSAPPSAEPASTVAPRLS